MFCPKPALFAAMLLLLFSCTKTGMDPEPVPPTPPDNPNGVLYINAVGYFVKKDVSDGKEHYWAQTYNLASSYRNPMVFDSTYFYHGNYSGITCYNAGTGKVAWGSSWYAFSDAISYQEPAFNDSMVFFSSPTSMWDHGYLYCRNKVTGQILWEKQIDSGYVDINFKGNPVVYGDRVITQTRNINNQYSLRAFSISTGETLWSTPLAGDLIGKIWIENGKLYTAYGSHALAFDALTGKPIWSIDLETPQFRMTFNFISNNEMVIVKVLNNSDYRIFRVQLGNGSMTRQDLSIPGTYSSIPDQVLAPLGCAYGNNQLYLAHYYNVDSLDIIDYDISTKQQRWKKRIANNLLTGQMPVLTDKYLVFPINDLYNTPDPYQTKILFWNLEGNEVKRLPIHTAYIDGFTYREGGVWYKQAIAFRQ